jgi:uncharacterized membrane protein (DUF2068 family)
MMARAVFLPPKVVDIMRRLLVLPRLDMMSVAMVVVVVILRKRRRSLVMRVNTLRLVRLV